MSKQQQITNNIIIMIRTLSFVLMAAVLVFASCQKSEGYYNPDKKINKIYESLETSYSIAGATSTNTVEKHVTESWTWNGNKLQKIECYNDEGELEETDVFTYDGNVLTKIEWDNQGRAEFVYDGKLLKSMSFYLEGKPHSEAHVTQRDGKKITEFLTYAFADRAEDSKCTHGKLTAMRLLIPEMAAKDIAQHTEALRSAKSKADITETNTIKLTWDGDNVTNMVMTSDATDTRIEQIYAYDNKRNPFKSHIYNLISPLTMNEWGSSNNPVFDSTNMTGSNYVSFGDRYTYEYDGEWPVTRIYSREIVTSYGTASTKQFVYYEYKD